MVDDHGGGEWAESELAVVAPHQGGHLAGIAPLFPARNLDGNPPLFFVGEDRTVIDHFQG
jgi:hypothetical protein